MRSLQVFPSQGGFQCPGLLASGASKEDAHDGNMFQATLLALSIQICNAKSNDEGQLQTVMRGGILVPRVADLGLHV